MSIDLTKTTPEERIKAAFHHFASTYGIDGNKTGAVYILGLSMAIDLVEEDGWRCIPEDWIKQYRKKEHEKLQGN